MNRTLPTYRDKPLLTGESVNRLAGAILSHVDRPGRVNLLKADWRAFIEQQFDLTLAQTGHLANVPAGHVDQIQRALNLALEEGGALQLILPSEAQKLGLNTDSQGELTITIQGTGPNPMLMIVNLKCRFDADCGNWSCTLS